jgi:hypothetical protein
MYKGVKKKEKRDYLQPLNSKESLGLKLQITTLTFGVQENKKPQITRIKGDASN